MYDVERTDYGLRLTVAGMLNQEEATEYAETVRSEVESIPGSFCILADLREMNTMPQEASDGIKELMDFCRANGLERSASVVDTTVSSMQMSRLKDDAGIDERVINAGNRSDWEAAALGWLEDGEEP